MPANQTSFFATYDDMKNVLEQLEREEERIYMSWQDYGDSALNFNVFEQINALSP
jgi:hypothetical protein